MNVLIVDDSKLARMAVGKLLTQHHPDWVRSEAANADEALAIVRDNPVDIVLIDFNMPGRDGLVLAAELRQLHPAARLALVSANHQQEIIAGARALGVSFLAKPLTGDELEAFLDGTPPASRKAGT